MRILALDLALQDVGWATSLDHFGVETGPGKLRGVERLDAWQDWLDHIAGGPAFDLAVIEGYAFSRVNQRGVRSTAEWGGVARLTLYQAGVPFVEVDPATLKKFATGRGNAPKPDMRMALYKRSGLDVADDNTVDALWLLAAGRELAGNPLWPMPKTQIEALSKVVWPSRVVEN